MVIHLAPCRPIFSWSDHWPSWPPGDPRWDRQMPPKHRGLVPPQVQQRREAIFSFFLPRVIVRSSVTITTEYPTLFQSCEDQVLLRRGRPLQVFLANPCQHWLDAGEQDGKSAMVGGR